MSFVPDYNITPRRIVCAANQHKTSGRIICGARHWDEVMRSQKLLEENWKDWKQGFIDQFGHWITREEAWDIAQEQGQIRRLNWDGQKGRLYSENLY